MFQLNVPGLYTAWCHSLLVSTVGCFFSACRKRECCMWLVNKVEIYKSKIGFLYCKWSNLNASRVIHPLLSFTFGVH